MPQLVQTWSFERLQPGKYPEDARTHAMPMAPAATGTTYTIMKGAPIGVQAASPKKGKTFVAGDKFGGYSLYTFTVDDTGKCYHGASAQIDVNRGSADTMQVFIHATMFPQDLTDGGAALAAATPAVPTTVTQDGFLQF